MSFYGWSETTVRSGITGAKGWVAYNWAFEHEANVWGEGVTRTTKGYIAQEIERLKHGQRRNNG